MVDSECSTVLGDLYKRYFISEKKSAVTSSHWATIGGHKVASNVGGYYLKGKGFGDWKDDNWVNRLLYFPACHMAHDIIRDNAVPVGMIQHGKRMARLTGRLFDYDCARQLRTACFIDDVLSEKAKIHSDCFRGVITIIGDGYGYLGAILKVMYPAAKIVEVNLGRTLFFDAYYLSKMFAERSHRLLAPGEPIRESDEFVYVEAELVDGFDSLDSDIFVNIVSMQEMDPPVICRYVNLMRKSSRRPTYFYCCNREEKGLPDGTVTRFSDYGWDDADEIFIDELCPWHQKYPSNRRLRWMPFDGPTRHRIVRLAPVLDRSE